MAQPWPPRRRRLAPARRRPLLVRAVTEPVTVRAVTLDAGGTLIDPARSVGAIYAEVAARHGCRADPALLDRRFAEAVDARPGPDAGPTGTPDEERAWWSAFVREVFGPGEGPADFDRFHAELHAVFAEPGTWRVYADAVPALERLRAEGFRLAIVSNWDSRLEALCARLGLRSLVQAVVTSSATGAAKPSPRIFHEAAARLGVRPGEVLHVGDRLREDVWGAQQAGLTPVWLRRRVADGDEDRTLDEIVSKGVDVVPSLVAVAPLAGRVRVP